MGNDTLVACVNYIEWKQLFCMSRCWPKGKCELLSTRGRCETRTKSHMRSSHIFVIKEILTWNQYFFDANDSNIQFILPHKQTEREKRIIRESHECDRDGTNARTYRTIWKITRDESTHSRAIQRYSLPHSTLLFVGVRVCVQFWLLLIHIEFLVNSNRKYYYLIIYNLMINMNAYTPASRNYCTHCCCCGNYVNTKVERARIAEKKRNPIKIEQQLQQQQ